MTRLLYCPQVGSGLHGCLSHYGTSQAVVGGISFFVRNVATVPKAETLLQFLDNQVRSFISKNEESIPGPSQFSILLYFFSLFRILAHESRNVTVRLNTGVPWEESAESTQK